MIPGSRKSVIDAAQALVSRRSTAGPVVQWQHIGESLADFDQRMIATRAAIAGPLLAVQAGRRTTPVLPGVRHVELQADAFEVLHPSAPARYRRLSGGRGSAKSWSIATVIVLHALTRPIRILCCREVQLSIRQSVHKLLTDTVARLGLDSYFDPGVAEITSTAGAAILFEGLFANASKLRSLEGIGLCWVEEAESVSDRSLEILIPTVRQRDSELWFSLNPDAADAPAYRRFVLNPPPDCRGAHTSYDRNPWIPDVLRREAEYLRSVDFDAYQHVWAGEPRHMSNAIVFGGKFVVEEFTPGADWSPMQGCDFGFSTDPSVLLRCWVHERVLYIEFEAWGLGVDIDALPRLFDQIPGARGYVTRADCSRPETISYLQQHGYPNMQSVEKWSGSVEDGIAHIRGYEKVVIHPRCTHTLAEFKAYSYKVDRLTNDVLPELKSGNDHCIDGLRYALTPLIRQRNPGILGWLAEANQADAKAALVNRPGVKVVELTSTGNH